MIRNYLVTAYRNLIRERATSLINMAGLTLGISGALVLFLIVRFSLSFDRFHEKKNRIYRVVTQSRSNAGYEETPGVPPALPDAFRNDFPEAEEVTFTSYLAGNSVVITIIPGDGEPVKFSENKGVVFAQPNFFKIFDRKIIAGSAEEGLDEPNEVILSRAFAIRYFGTEDAIGNVLRYENLDYRVTAIMEDCPDNTDLPFEVMLSYITIKQQHDQEGWNGIWSDDQCFVLIREGESATAIEARIPQFVRKYLGEDNPDERTHLLQPLAEMHHDDRFGNYNYNTVPKPVLLALAVVAAFLIITACINFINLSTAEAIKRSKEVGIRKSLGSTRAQLILQHLAESSVLTVAAVVLSLVACEVVLSFLNPFLDLSLSLDPLHDPLLLGFLIGITILVSLLSGAYPAFVVSGYKPVFALKNSPSDGTTKGYSLRKSLVVVQFFISQFFLIGTLVLIKQMNFVNQRDLGFSKEAIVTFPIPEQETPVEGDGTSKMRVLRDEISKLAGIGAASLNSAPPSSGNVSTTDFRMEGREEHYATQVKQVDGAYIDLFKLELLAGKNLMDQDTAMGFVVNEKLLKTLQISDPQEIIGKEMRMWGKRLPVVGVVKDFHTVSLANPVEPLVLLNRIRGYGNLSVEIASSEIQEVLNQIRGRWEAAYPEAVFSYEFLEEEIEGFYEGQRRMAVLFSVFTSVAIFIGCLGLLGLATFMAARRTKEIGVRKVMGASVTSILAMFSREFVVLVGVGFLLAAPAAWYFSRMYLNQFAYKIELGPESFLVGIGGSLLVAILTVGYRTLRAATANPADSLRYE